MQNLLEAWPIVAAAAVVVFGSGSLVEKMRNGKYASKETCSVIHRNIDQNIGEMKDDIRIIKEHLIK